MSLSAELGSVLSTLETLTSRVAELADGLAGSEDEDLSLPLIEVERLMVTAGRRLERVVRDLPRR